MGSFRLYLMRVLPLLALSGVAAGSITSTTTTASTSSDDCLVTAIYELNQGAKKSNKREEETAKQELPKQCLPLYVPGLSPGEDHLAQACLSYIPPPDPGYPAALRVQLDTARDDLALDETLFWAGWDLSKLPLEQVGTRTTTDHTPDFESALFTHYMALASASGSVSSWEFTYQLPPSSDGTAAAPSSCQQGQTEEFPIYLSLRASLGKAKLQKRYPSRVTLKPDRPLYTTKVMVPCSCAASSKKKTKKTEEEVKEAAAEDPEEVLVAPKKEQQLLQGHGQEEEQAGTSDHRRTMGYYNPEFGYTATTDGGGGEGIAGVSSYASTTGTTTKADDENATNSERLLRGGLFGSINSGGTATGSLTASQLNGAGGQFGNLGGNPTIGAGSVQNGPPGLAGGISTQGNGQVPPGQLNQIQGGIFQQILDQQDVPDVDIGDITDYLDVNGTDSDNEDYLNVNATDAAPDSLDEPTPTAAPTISPAPSAVEEVDLESLGVSGSSSSSSSTSTGKPEMCLSAFGELLFAQPLCFGMQADHDAEPEANLCVDLKGSTLEVKITAIGDYNLLMNELWVGPAGISQVPLVDGSLDISGFPFFNGDFRGEKEAQWSVDLSSYCEDGLNEHHLAMVCHSLVETLDANGNPNDASSQSLFAMKFDNPNSNAPWFGWVDLVFECDCEAARRRRLRGAGNA